MEVFAHETGRLLRSLQHTVVTRSAAVFVKRAFSGIFVR